ncbi:hypothetical protein [Akkermansia glycaniphila]|nr:hypothetical protein [Akkermansia glycaniphila]
MALLVGEEERMMVFFVAEKRAEKERKKGCEIIIYDVLINEN